MPGIQSRPWTSRPELRVPEPDSEGGRGLQLVAALAQRWAVGERCGPGKAVRAEVHVREPDSRGRNDVGRVPVG
ncbi:hypothetical protein [Streptomyces sp. NPDC005805]|uniref:hypothetical protein n=1 Tax=Streptomyces sp. NPDC005805 TaxID=3157068 RepID=UPI0033E388FC